MRIYTRRGDDGTTGIHGGARVRKTDARIEANGSLDELNSIIGVARSFSKNEDRGNLLEYIQKNIMTTMSIVATPSECRAKNPRRLPEGIVSEMERNIDAISANGVVGGNFVLPGGGACAAFFHLARTVCRRAERDLWRLHESDMVDAEVMTFVNRLSDLLFAMALESCADEGADIDIWEPFNAIRVKSK